MGGKSKSPILVVLIIISLCFVGLGFYLYNKEHARNLELQEKLDDITTRFKITQSELDKAKEKVSTLGLQLKDAQIQIEKLTSELSQERTAKQEALTQLEQLNVSVEQLKAEREQLRIEKEQLRAELQQQKNLKIDLENKLAEAQRDAKNLQEQLKKLESQRASLESEIKELKTKEESEEGVELGTIIVTPESATVFSEQTTPAETLSTSKPTKTSRTMTAEGKVLVINKDYDFAVIGLGSKDGVNIGDVFSVYHENKYIGDLKVEKVHDAMSAAGFVSAEVKNRISEGDRVVRKQD